MHFILITHDLLFLNVLNKLGFEVVIVCAYFPQYHLRICQVSAFKKKLSRFLERVFRIPRM
jgi:hypothetical protein